MTKRRGVQWLYEELPVLVDAGVLSAETAAQLQTHYSIDIQPRRSLALIICSILGALLIGLGIILLFAHNWQNLSRPVRTVLAFLPLLTGQILTGWVIFRRAESVAWREGASVFLITGIGVAIALVSQTYHIPGDLASFLLTWILLSLPLAYLVRASLPAALVWIGLTAWAGYAQQHWRHAVLFWPLAAALVPHLWMSAQEQPSRLRTVWLSWVLALCLCIATGLALEHTLPGLWIVIYTSLFATFYLIDGYWFDAAPARWQRPWQVVGVIGIAALSLALTYKSVWRGVRWGRYRTGWQYNAWATVGDYVLALVLLALAIWLLIAWMRRQQWEKVPFGAAVVVATLAYITAIVGGAPEVSMLLFNVYVLWLGINAIRSGIRQGRLGTMNGGLLLVGALITARFFDIDLSFTARGIVFIGLGIAFLVTNIVMKQRMVMS